MQDVSGKVLIDTNVLIYATLEGDPRFSRVQDILMKRGPSDYDIAISVQNLAEMYPNLTGSKMETPGSPEVARKKIQAIAAGLSHVQVLPAAPYL